MDSNSNERDSLNHEPSPTQDKEKQYDGDNPNTISLESTDSSSTCANAKGRYQEIIKMWQKCSRINITK